MFKTTRIPALFAAFFLFFGVAEAAVPTNVFLDGQGGLFFTLRPGRFGQLCGPNIAQCLSAPTRFKCL